MKNSTFTWKIFSLNYANQVFCYGTVVAKGDAHFSCLCCLEVKSQDLSITEWVTHSVIQREIDSVISHPVYNQERPIPAPVYDLAQIQDDHTIMISGNNPLMLFFSMAMLPFPLQITSKMFTSVLLMKFDCTVRTCIYVRWLRNC